MTRLFVRLRSFLASLNRYDPCPCGGERKEIGPVSGWIVCLKCGEGE